MEDLVLAVDRHKVEPAHHDSNSRLNLAEERIVVLDQERRDLCQDVKDLQKGQKLIQRTVDALCIASPRCRLKGVR